MSSTPRLPPPPYAIVYRPNGALSICGLREGNNSIGRQDGCQVRVDDALVSRHHADLILDDSGGVVLDRGSTNGVEINGVRHERARVVDGDVLRMGSSEVALRLGRSKKAAPAGLPGDLDLYAAALVSRYYGPDARPGAATVAAITAYVRETGTVRSVSHSTTQRRIHELARVLGAPRQLLGRGRANRLWPWLADELRRRGY